MSDELKIDPLNRPVVGKEVRDLAEEIRADEQAAKERDDGDKESLHDILDGVGQEKYREHLKESAERALARMQGNPSSEYEKRLDEASKRSSNQSEDKSHDR
jgi:GTP cyclohydrolase I